MTESLVGSRLAHFELTARLGRGGMGEVYRATDTRLGREVAIKILPPELAGRRDLRARLEREARALSSLNHPHICTLHDIGIDGGTTFLVMELVEGRTLRERLREGPVPLGEALRLAVEIADALASAHGRGLIHRDLKPANVMLTADGAKLLDFGLAKTLVPDALALDSRAPTLTTEGAVLGTPQYMAPEQVTGEETDARTDVFAFGLLLYEVLSGERVFPSENVHELVAAILRQEPPPLGERVEALPPALLRLVERCLAKRPAARWQCAADLAAELRWIASGGAVAVGGPAWEGHRRHRRWLAASGIAALVVATLGFALGLHFGGRKTAANEVAGAAPATWLSIPLPEDAPFLPAKRSALAISPDGRLVVYSGGDEDHRRLFARSLASGTVRPLDGTEGAVGPFFSPDGRRIAFFTPHSLGYVPAAGGPFQELGLAPPVTRGAVWLSSGDIAVTPSKAGRLYHTANQGGPPWEPLTRIDPASGGGQTWPSFFDDERKVLVTVAGPTAASYDEARIVAIDIASGRQQVVVEGGSQARYLPSGHLVFVRRGALLAAPFDSGSMRLTGEPTELIDGVLSDPESGVAQMAISPTGTLVFARGEPASTDAAHLAWIDRSGAEVAIPGAPRAIVGPHISPDGSLIVLSIQGASDDLWLYDLARETFRRLTFGGRNASPIWAPDGHRVTYMSVRGQGFPEIYEVAADGSGRDEPVARDETAALFPGSWSADGSTLALSRFGGPTGWDVYLVSPGEAPRPFIATRFNESAPRISPDGTWLAYCSDESGRPEVYVTSFPVPGQKLQVSAGGGSGPVWDRQGRELFYRAGGRLMAVRLESGSALRAGVPAEVLPRLPPTTKSSVVGAPDFDIAADGRFLVVHRQPLPRIHRLEVVLDWFRELERRVPLPE